MREMKFREGLKINKDVFECLKDGRCKTCQFAKILSGGGWSYVGCTHKPYIGKWVAEIKDCPINKVAERE